MAQVDQMVRSRLAEMMAAAGVEQSRRSVEVLYDLPRQFTQAYEVLHDLATRGVQGPDTRSRVEEVGVKDDPRPGGGGGGRTVDTETSRERYAEVVVRSGGSSRRAARGGAKGSASGLRLGDDMALELKTRVDKRLRGLAREVMDELRELGLGFNEVTGESMVRLGTNRRDRTGRGEVGSVGDELVERVRERTGIVEVELPDGTITHQATAQGGVDGRGNVWSSTNGPIRSG